MKLVKNTDFFAIGVIDIKIFLLEIRVDGIHIKKILRAIINRKFSEKMSY
jgi:hypothetical protein